MHSLHARCGRRELEAKKPDGLAEALRAPEEYIRNEKQLVVRRIAAGVRYRCRL